MATSGCARRGRSRGRAVGRPRRLGGVGADQAHRVCNSRGYRRRRRSNGALDGRHQRQAQARAAGFHRCQQVRGCGRRRLLAREGKEG